MIFNYIPHIIYPLRIEKTHKPAQICDNIHAHVGNASRTWQCYGYATGQAAVYQN